MSALRQKMGKAFFNSTSSAANQNTRFAAGAVTVYKENSKHLSNSIIL